VRTIEVAQPTQEGVYMAPLLPSVVAVLGATTYVGEGAKRLRSDAALHGLRPYQTLFFDCKNEMGVRKTYPRAPKGLQSAAQVGGRVLRTLYDAARTGDDSRYDRVVITVPASFQVAQRTDTIKAASLAGLELTGGDLLDEPLAAFLDYLATHPDEIGSVKGSARNLVVFDFGGGTCDVAVFRLAASEGGAPMGIESLAVSRYHRLGGGDIDAAIVHEVLIPELRRQNDIGPHDLSYEDKKRLLEPSLLGTAESLKIALCSEVRRLRAFGKGAESAADDVATTQPVTKTIPWKGRDLRLERPSLTQAQFRALLAPFLDRSALFARETDYRMTCSIFAPLEDALDRAGVPATGVDLCLMVGGSSLLPQVVDAVDSFFPNARILAYDDADDSKTCVSRGAAYHALSLALTGAGLVVPTAGDSLCIRHVDGHSVLVQRGTPLPHPPDGTYAEHVGFAFPEASNAGVVPLRVEITAGDGRLLHAACVDLPGPVARADKLRVECRMDANHVLHLRVRKEGDPPGCAQTTVVENPFTNVVNPGSTRERIEETEERLRTQEIPKEEAAGAMRELSSLYVESGHWEKAAEYLSRSMRLRGVADEELLGRLAALYERIGDVDRADQYFAQALQAGSWTGTRFNYALVLRRRGDDARGWAVLAPVLGPGAEPPYLVLGAMLQEKLGDASESRRLLSDALRKFDPIGGLSDWALGWYVTGASMTKDARTAEEGREEQRRRAHRRKDDDAPPLSDGLLPMLCRSH
jgi:hypothetical protein